MEDADYKFRWINPDDSRGADDVGYSYLYRKYWLQDEPSYGMMVGDTYVDEDCVNMFYHKKSKSFVWNDAPSEVLKYVSSYKGRIAYIIEFDQ
jgi:hypothetical protein